MPHCGYQLTDINSQPKDSHQSTQQPEIRFDGIYVVDKCIERKAFILDRLFNGYPSMCYLRYGIQFFEDKTYSEGFVRYESCKFPISTSAVKRENTNTYALNGSRIEGIGYNVTCLGEITPEGDIRNPDNDIKPDDLFGTGFYRFVPFSS